MNTAPISGMQELLPSDQAKFNQIKAQIADQFSLHGFHNIETPIIDRTEILLAKAGGDTEKQIYKVVKTAETADDADQALRFDHTVPLARYVAEHENELAFPFKVSQIGRNFRGERAQKGRFREFYQLDVDVIGRNQLPLAYDADAIATTYLALSAFIKTDICLRVSNRKILKGLLEELNLDKISDQIFSIIDHAEKVSDQTTQASLQELELNDTQIQTLTDFMQIRGETDSVLTKLKALEIENSTFKAGVSELAEVLQLLLKLCPNGQITGDMLIVRGLDYYTGTVFETFLPEYRQIGSVCSGGRYDNLASNYTDQKLPGVGGSIGLTRLFYVLRSNQLLPQDLAKTYVAIIPVSDKEVDYCLELAEELRQKQIIADTVFTDKKLGDKLKYAAKTATHAIIIGENEVKSEKPMIKDLNTGNINPLDEFIAASDQHLGNI